MNLIGCSKSDRQSSDLIGLNRSDIWSIEPGIWSEDLPIILRFSMDGPQEGRIHCVWLTKVDTSTHTSAANLVTQLHGCDPENLSATNFFLLDCEDPVPVPIVVNWDSVQEIKELHYNFKERIHVFDGMWKIKVHLDFIGETKMLLYDKYVTVRNAISVLLDSCNVSLKESSAYHLLMSIDGHTFHLEVRYLQYFTNEFLEDREDTQVLQILRRGNWIEFDPFNLIRWNYIWSTSRNLQSFQDQVLRSTYCCQRISCAMSVCSCQTFRPTLLSSCQLRQHYQKSKNELSRDWLQMLSLPFLWKLKI